MAAYLLTAVTAEGYGLTYHWGDTYEVRAESYEAAEADVLGRAGGDGGRPYERIVKAWARDGALWAELPLGRPVSREELALTVACPECRAGTAEKCRRLKAIGMSRVATRDRILHPHAVRIAKARQGADQMTVWRAPSGLCHLHRGCTGGAGASRMTEVFVSEAQFAGLPRCRCLSRFKGA